MLKIEGKKNILKLSPRQINFNEKWRKHFFEFFFFSVPEIPCLADVPYLSVDNFHPDLEKKLHKLFQNEGRVLERAPAQVLEIEERPGSLLITWAEVRLAW